METNVPDALQRFATELTLTAPTTVTCAAIHATLTLLHGPVRMQSYTKTEHVPSQSIYKEEDSLVIHHILLSNVVQLVHRYAQTMEHQVGNSKEEICH